MVSGLLCGIGSLPRDEDEYERHTRSAGSSPRKSRASSKANKNPYSDRGLDKFTALLAEIEEKRRQIYSQVDPNEISLVRFVYSGDHDFKPIVVKAKTKVDHEKNNLEFVDVKGDNGKLSKLPSSSTIEVPKEKEKDDNLCEKTRRKIVFYKKLNQPMLYLAMIVMLILVIFVLFGRSFAIMCTSIGWYVIPSITNHPNNVPNKKTSFKKKDYSMKRRFSDKKIMSREGTKSFNHRKSF